MQRSRKSAENRKGLEEGKAEGKVEAKLQMAKDLRSNGVSLEIIAKCTGLSAEEIEAL